MGLSSQLKDVSSDSIPILLVVAAAGWVAYLRSLLHCLLHSLGLLLRPDDAASAASLGSGLAGLIALADHLHSATPFLYEDDGPGAQPQECVVCLSGLADGGRLARRLSGCQHVFHADCLDRWFDQMNLSCPLCRSPLVPEDRRADAERRIGADLIAWFAPHAATMTL